MYEQIKSDIVPIPLLLTPSGKVQFPIASSEQFPYMYQILWTVHRNCLTSGDNYIAKLKVDYIKHNTTVAFPSILFVKDEIIEIPYKITSKNYPDVVEGVLKVQNSNV